MFYVHQVFCQLCQNQDLDQNLLIIYVLDQLFISIIFLSWLRRVSPLKNTQLNSSICPNLLLPDTSLHGHILFTSS